MGRAAARVPVPVAVAVMVARVVAVVAVPSVRVVMVEAMVRAAVRRAEARLIRLLPPPLALGEGGRGGDGVVVEPVVALLLV